MIRSYSFFIYVFYLCTAPFMLHAQDSIPNKYGLVVIHTIQSLQKTIQKNPEKEIIDLVRYIPGLAMDMKYIGTDHFLQTSLYDSMAMPYARKPLATALATVQAELNEQGLGLKIWDAYRPYQVTQQIWKKVPDNRYAADPATGSAHNRGMAIDLTLIHLNDQQELDMGTRFDHFSDTAHHDFNNLPTQIKANRNLLKSVMMKHGFVALNSEWWHYHFQPAKEFEILDISFKDLAAALKK